MNDDEQTILYHKGFQAGKDHNLYASKETKDRFCLFEEKLEKIEKVITNGNGKKSFIDKLRDRWFEIFILIAGLVASFYGLKMNIAMLQRDILEIKTNHLVHIESIVNENKVKNEKQDEQISSILLKVERLITILEKR